MCIAHVILSSLSLEKKYYLRLSRCFKEAVSLRKPCFNKLCYGTFGLLHFIKFKSCRLRLDRKLAYIKGNAYHGLVMENMYFTNAFILKTCSFSQLLFFFLKKDVCMLLKQEEMLNL